jgi:glycosyltransferase involved in cell wall biosynthesis
VRHGENGYRFAPGDVPAAAGQLRALLTDAPLRDRMGSASLGMIARHSLDASLERFETLYGEAGAQSAAAPPAVLAA